MAAAISVRLDDEAEPPSPAGRGRRRPFDDQFVGAGSAATYTAKVITAEPRPLEAMSADHSSIGTNINRRRMAHGTGRQAPNPAPHPDSRVPKGEAMQIQGVRYGVVVQADELLPVVNVIALSNNLTRGPTSTVSTRDCRRWRHDVLVEQLGAVDAQRLGDQVGYLSPDELWSVDDALITVLGLT